MPTKIYLPLRSNLSYFQAQGTVDALERQLKVNIALFDRVILQDGTFVLMSDGNGQGVALMMPQNAKGYDRTQHKFQEPGGQFSMMAGDIPLVIGNLSFGANADFMPIINKAGLTQATYLEWVSLGLEPEVEKQIGAVAKTDSEDKDVSDDLPRDRYLKKELVNGFYRDALVAQHLKVPFAIDHHLAGFVRKKSQSNSLNSSPTMQLAFYKNWANFRLPDFTTYTWEQIHELHESPVGEDFRRMIGRIAESVNGAMVSSPSVDELKALIKDAYIAELVLEVQRRCATFADASLDALLNIIPYGSLKCFNHSETFEPLG